MDSVAITAWPDLTSPIGRSGIISKNDLLSWIRKPEVVADKKTLPGFSLARFRDDRRARANVVAVSAIGLDDDASGLSVEDVAARLSAFAGVVYSTHSSTPAHPRTRTILFTTRDLTAVEYAAVWAYVREQVHEAGLVIDAATKDPSRLWFVPAVRPDAAFEYAELDGSPLDVDAVLAAAPSIKSSIETKTYPGDVSDEDERAHRRALYTAFLKTVPPCVQGRGGDSQLFEVVQRGAYDLQLPTEDVLELVAEHYDPRCVPPWGDELASRVMHKSHSAKTTSTRPRNEPLPRDVAELISTPKLKPTSADTPTAHPLLPVVWGKWNDALQAPVYLVEGLIPEGKVTTFFAEGGSVKSWTAFDLAISVATGKSWLGRAVVQGKVLILDFEDGRYEFQRRKRILTQNDEDIPNLGYCYCGPRLNEPELWSALATMDLRLIVVDTLGSGMPSDADENNSTFAEGVKMAGVFTEAVESKCNVLFVAHANKQGGLRGASAIRDQSDIVFKFEPVSETSQVKRMRMICDKPGPQKKPAPVNLELSDDGLTTFDETAKTPATGGADVRAAILLALESHGPIPSKRKIRTIVGRKTDVVDPEIEALVKTGEVVFIDGEGYQPDSDERRQRRALAALAGGLFGSTAQLGKASFTTTRFVDSLVRKGVIARSAEGRLIATSRGH